METSIKNLQNQNLHPNTRDRNTKKEIIIISGSSGLIATGLINKLSEHYRVAGLDEVGYPFPPIKAECICIDITSDESMENAMKRIEYGYGNHIASVIHLAAYYDFSGKPSPLYDKVTVEGTARLLRLLQRFTVDQFIFSSSTLVYKPSMPGQKIDEDWPLEPKWDYPVSKVQTEEILHEQRGDIPVVNFRIAGVFSEKGGSIPITNQIQRIYEKQITSHFYPGNLSHGNVFVHLDDLFDAIILAVDKRKELPKDVTINLGDPETLGYQELQNIISNAINGKDWKTYKIPKALAKAGAWVQDIFGDPFIKPWMVDLADDHSEIDITQAKNLLGWQPKHSLRETLPKMIAFLKDNPEAFYKVNKLKK
jgi:nucleoside-diphosphate-sugar epimerase